MYYGNEASMGCINSFCPKDAGVVGIPNEESGEVPRAFIVRAPGSTITGSPFISKFFNT